MNLTAWLDVAIGLIVVYLGASLFVTIIGEFVSQAFNLRGKVVWDSLDQLIKSPELRAKLSLNPALQPFFGKDAKNERSGAPSYVDPVLMARCLLGSATESGASVVATLPHELQVAVGVVGNRTEQMVAAVSHWIDSSLTVLGERYKRYQRKVSFGVGAVVAIALNLDTVALTNRLYGDKEARDATVAVAIDVTGRTDKQTFEDCMKLKPAERANDGRCAALNGLVNAVQRRNATVGMLPIGWSEEVVDVHGSLWTWLVRAAGWLLTALALSLGAPFWFDTLGRLVNVRNGIRRPDVRSALASAEGEPESGAQPGPVPLSAAGRK